MGKEKKTNTHYVDLTIVIRKEDDMYASYCLELGTASCGDSLEEALQNIKDAIWVHLNGLEQAGERARFFREHNIRPKTHMPKRIAPAKRNVYTDAFTTRFRTPVCA